LGGENLTSLYQVGDEHPNNHLGVGGNNVVDFGFGFGGRATMPRCEQKEGIWFWF